MPGKPTVLPSTRTILPVAAKKRGEFPTFIVVAVGLPVVAILVCSGIAQFGQWLRPRESPVAVAPPAASVSAPPPASSVPTPGPSHARQFVYSWTPLDFNKAELEDDFDAFYRGRVIEVRRFVKPFPIPPPPELPYLILCEGGPDADQPVVCVFSPQDVPMLRTLHEDDLITIRGTCGPFEHIGGLQLVHCVIVRGR